MSSTAIANIIRFIGLVLLQVLIVKQIELGPIGGSIVQIYVYPLFILLLPYRISREVILLLGFLLGITIDLFYDSAGLHASATVFMAFARTYVLRMVEPRAGYDKTKGLTPIRINWNWFARYSAILIFLHSLWFHVLDTFNFSLLGTILLKTIISFAFSILFMFILVLIFNPKD